MDQNPHWRPSAGEGPVVLRHLSDGVPLLSPRESSLDLERDLLREIESDSEEPVPAVEVEIRDFVKGVTLIHVTDVHPPVRPPALARIVHLEVGGAMLEILSRRRLVIDVRRFGEHLPRSCAELAEQGDDLFARVVGIRDGRWDPVVPVVPAEHEGRQPRGRVAATRVPRLRIVVIADIRDLGRLQTPAVQDAGGIAQGAGTGANRAAHHEAGRVDRQRPALVLEARQERLRERGPEDPAVMIEVVPATHGRVLAPQLEIESVRFRPLPPEPLHFEADLVVFLLELRDDLGEHLEVIAKADRREEVEGAGEEVRLRSLHLVAHAVVGGPDVAEEAEGRGHRAHVRHEPFEGLAVRRFALAG